MPYSFQLKFDRVLLMVLAALLSTGLLAQSAQSAQSAQTAETAQGSQTIEGEYDFVLEPLETTRYLPQFDALAPVTQLSVEEGDRFLKGDLLLQLDVAKFEALVNRAKANLEKAQAEFQANSKLYEDHSQSYVELASSKAQLASANSELVIAEKNLEAARVYAPYSGLVSKLAISEFELPHTDKVMLEIINDRFLRGKLLIPSSKLSKLKVGDAVMLNVADNGAVLQATLSRLAAAVDPASGTLEVEVLVDNENGVLRAGMSGTALFVSRNKNDVEVKRGADQ